MMGSRWVRAYLVTFFSTTLLVASSCAPKISTPELDVVFQSSLSAPTAPVVADGTASVTVSITLIDRAGVPYFNTIPVLAVTDTESKNVYSCTRTDHFGKSTCTLTSTKAEIKTINVSFPFLMAGPTVSFIPGPPDHLRYLANPSGGTAGIAWGTQPIVQEYDAHENVTTQSTDTIQIDTYSDSACTVLVAGTTGTPNPNTIPAGTGTVSFSGIQQNTTGTYYVGATKPGVTSACYGPVQVVHNTPTQTVWQTAPPASAVAGVNFAPQPVVKLLDAFNNLCASSTAAITLKLFTNNTCTSAAAPAISATTNPLNATGGVSTFSGVVYNKVQAPLYIQASSPGTTTTPCQALTMNPNSASAATTTISGTSPVAANSYNLSTITITDLDVYNNPRVGETPTFNATDTGATNGYGACSATNAAGVSTCTLKSGTAEAKIPHLITPVAVNGAAINFITPPSATKTTITGSSAVADGVAASTITVTLKDAGNSPVVGLTPTFSATDTGGTNSYGACSASNGAGVSTCTLKSTKAEVKTLSLVQPLAMSGGTATFTAGPVSAGVSTVTSSPTSVVANGTTSTITVTLLDAFGNPVSGKTVTLTSSRGATDTVSAASGASTAGGVVTFTVSSLTTGTPTFTAVDSTDSITITATAGVTFTAGPAVAGSSSIVVTNNVVADGVATATIAIQIRDVNNNGVPAASITLGVTGTANTVSGGCTSTNASGNASCTISTTKAETKTFNVTAPVVINTTATFIPGAAAKVIYTTAPSLSALIGDLFATQPVAVIEDANSNLVNSSVSVVLKPYTDGTCTTLAGGTVSNATVSAVAGTATFANVSYDTEAAIYWGATSAGLTTACSSLAHVNRWGATSATNMPSARYLHTAIWTGTKMVVWGGYDGSAYLNTGAIYDPSNDTWTTMSTGSAPSIRAQHTAVWTGSKMIVFGGYNGTTYLADGGQFDPGTNTWSALPLTGLPPAARARHTAVYTGTQMFIWGGYSGAYLNDGAYFDTGTNVWISVSSASPPSIRADHTAVYDSVNNTMVIWGGYNGAARLSNGGVYSIAGNSWTATQTSGAPSVRNQHSAIWNGTLMVVFGGFDGTTYLGDGFTYNSAGAGTWATLPTLTEPSVRSGHSAIWNAGASQMIIWGGYDGAFLDTGGQYKAGVWTATSIGYNVPTGRDRHTAVWTGSRMVLFGGCTNAACTSLIAGGTVYKP